MRINDILPRSFYAGDGLSVAAALLGKYVVRRLPDGSERAGRVVETEAYVGPDDQASHARRGPTPRAAIMFGPPGRAYVYLIYGVSHCLNVVCDRDGFPSAILVRALEPAEGVAGGTDGPGKLCKALGITRADNGADLCDPAGGLWLEDRGGPHARVLSTPRIGVDYAGEWAARPWRFVDAESRWLSRKLPKHKSSIGKGE
jgi:DNA-3-methyladenine glycosylase